VPDLLVNFRIEVKNMGRHFMLIPTNIRSGLPLVKAKNKISRFLGEQISKGNPLDHGNGMGPDGYNAACIKEVLGYMPL